MQNLSFKYESNLHENEPVGRTHFHMNGFARRLVLTQRQKTTQKWPIRAANLKFFATRYESENSNAKRLPCFF